MSPLSYLHLFWTIFVQMLGLKFEILYQYVEFSAHTTYLLLRPFLKYKISNIPPHVILFLSLPSLSVSLEHSSEVRS